MRGETMSGSSVLICACRRARVYPDASLDALVEALKSAGVNFEIVPDLCEMAGRADARLAGWAKDGVTVVACHPRAVRWLFDAAGAPLLSSVALRNFRSEPVSAISLAIRDWASLKTGSVQSQVDGAASVIATRPGREPAPDWPGWFPVIDHERCTQCMQCLSFCLFGVYEVDDQSRPRVVNPDQCKPNCPACARVCPQGAILFPKHPAASISGGESAASPGVTPKVDISALLGGNVHDLLRERNARARTRFSKDRSQAESIAERRRRLERAGLFAEDIPADVLAELPSPEEIAVKVQEAAARAKAALEARRKP
jgi:Pyruvate/2-oxoacid:ferredoxin oxidoreductase delta subunit